MQTATLAKFNEPLIKDIKHEAVEELAIRSPEMFKKQIAAKALETDYVIIPLNQLNVTQ